MLTRFEMNVAKYPKLFKTLLVGCILAVVEFYIPLLVGINARQVLHANLVDLALSLVLAILIYRWVFRNAGRTAIFLEIADCLEGREVCTMSEHQIDDEEFVEDDDSIIEEPEPDEEEEIL
jgi:hypothetical protein